jgi:hypothetical protein
MRSDRSVVQVPIVSLVPTHLSDEVASTRPCNELHSLRDIILGLDKLSDVFEMSNDQSIV